MKKRLLSSLVFVFILVVAFILKFYVSNYFFDVVILLIAGVAAYETSQIFTKMGKYNNQTLSLLYPCFLMFVLIMGVANDNSLGVVYTILIGLGVMALFFLIAFGLPFIFYKRTKIELKTRKMENQTILKYSFNKALNTLITFAYPTLLICCLTFINHFEDLKTTFSGLKGFGGYISLFVLLFAFLVPIFTDTFAYLMGGLIGGKKLAPKISPKKTIAGAVGGLLWCVLLSVTVFCLFNAFPKMNEYFVLCGINIWKIAIISAIGSVLGQAGDLFESYLKRLAGVKDSGNIMPGHGGMLDRFDSHIFVAPFIFVAFSIIFALI